MVEKSVISSPIRWAGSKKRLLNEMIEKMFVTNDENYVEPFLGSAVVLLNVLNNKLSFNFKKFYVNDINYNIINFYISLKVDSLSLISSLEKVAKKYNALTLDEQEKFYYDMREKFNSTSKNDKKKVIYFYFLMKTGFNGVYRENSKGKFNVPFGKKTRVIIDKHLLLDISNKIQNVEFYNMDYKDFFKYLKKEKIINSSFIYCDPPYLPDDDLVYQKHILYTKDMFNHEEFFGIVNDIKANIMISMSDSTIASKIYGNGVFKKENVSEIIRTINPNKLFKSTEIAFINYEIDKEN